MGKIKQLQVDIAESCEHCYDDPDDTELECYELSDICESFGIVDSFDS